ncbi:hypothetical protein BH11CYA1_BH11CYA1_35660 [soil metagenome]
MSKSKEIVLSVALATYIFFTITWLCPEAPLKTRILEPVKQFWLFWGLEQNWKLFSPTIREINFHSEAVLTYSNGERMIVEMPRMNRLSYGERFRLEKFRKWSIDSLPWPDYKEFWPDFARYIGKKHFLANNKPSSLALNLYWIEIPKPVEGQIVPVAALPQHTKMSTVFFYKYKAEDLP